MDPRIAKAAAWGSFSAGSLLGTYFLVVSFISGFAFTLSQFGQFWYFLVGLALGFGIQVGLYSYLRQIVRGGGSGKVVAVTGTTSTAAMVSCCAHYLVNVLPVLGATGIATIAAQYQVEFFWLGLLFNFLGIAFVAGRITKVKVHE